MATISFYARGDSNTANNAAINAVPTSTVPTTLLTFSSFDPDGAGPLTGDIQLDYNGGLPDPDTRVTLNGGPAQTFTVQIMGFMPSSGGGGNALSNVNGVDLRGVRVVVVTVAGQRYFFFPDLNVSAATMSAIISRAYTLTSTTTTGPILICFVAGTLIATPSGERPVEGLKAGDEVLTADGRAVRLLWAGHRRVTPQELARHPELLPVRIPAGFFGPECPHSPLEVSPQHRIWVESWQVEISFGFPSALVPAKHLVADRAEIGATKPAAAVDYYHLLCEDHEIVVSNGLPSETLQPTAENVRDLDPAAKTELALLFPEGIPAELAGRASAAPSLKAHEGRLIAATLT